MSSERWDRFDEPSIGRWRPTLTQSPAPPRQRNVLSLGSAKETWACIDVAIALGYVESVDAEIREGLRSVQRVLARLVA